MPADQTPEPERPFDPDAPKRLAEAAAAAQELGQGYTEHDNADVTETLRQLAYAKTSRHELAEDCRNWRIRYEETRAKLEAAPAAPRRVWILECNYWTDIRAYATDQDARSAAEQWVRENAARRPVTGLEWRPAPDERGDLHELWKTADGHAYPANLIVYSLPVLGAMGSGTKGADGEASS